VIKGTVCLFNSQAQRKLAQLLVDGKISPKIFEEWNRETVTRKLPDRAGSAEKRMPLSSNKSAVKIKVLRPRQNGTAAVRKSVGTHAT
jgi:hypothetical protein